MIEISWRLTLECIPQRWGDQLCEMLQVVTGGQVQHLRSDRLN